jgi:hypothetical protein
MRGGNDLYQALEQCTHGRKVGAETVRSQRICQCQAERD